MGSKNEKIHDFLIENSRKFPFIKNEIRNNGVLQITKQNIDLFSFMVKTIIALGATNSCQAVRSFGTSKVRSQVGRSGGLQ